MNIEKLRQLFTSYETEEECIKFLNEYFIDFNNMAESLSNLSFTLKGRLYFNELILSTDTNYNNLIHIMAKKNFSSILNIFFASADIISFDGILLCEQHDIIGGIFQKNLDNYTPLDLAIESHSIESIEVILNQLNKMDGIDHYIRYRYNEFNNETIDSSDHITTKNNKIPLLHNLILSKKYRIIELFLQHITECHNMNSSDTLDLITQLKDKNNKSVYDLIKESGDIKIMNLFITFYKDYINYSQEAAKYLDDIIKKRRQKSEKYNVSAGITTVIDAGLDFSNFFISHFIRTNIVLKGLLVATHSIPVMLIVASLYYSAKLYKSQKIKDNLNENEKMCKNKIQELESIILERKIDNKITEVSSHISPCISITLSSTSIKESTTRISSDNFSEGKESSANMSRISSKVKLCDLKHSFPRACIISTGSNVSLKLPIKNSAKVLKIYKKSYERRNTLSSITGIPNNQPVYTEQHYINESLPDSFTTTKEKEPLSSKVHYQSLPSKSTSVPRSLTTDIASLPLPLLEDNVRLCYSPLF